MAVRFFHLSAGLLLLVNGERALAQHEGHDHGPATPPPATQPAAEQGGGPTPSTLITDPDIPALELLRRDASLLLSTVQSPSVRQYLFNSNFMPVIDQPRVVYYSKATREAFSPDDFGNLSPERQKGFEAVTLGDRFYYHTRYGSPHAYARALDLLCQAANADGNCFGPGKSILDFGNGGVIQLRLLAVMGMKAVGVDVDLLLRAFYREPTDVGKIQGQEEGTVGFVQLEYGPWPADVTLRKAVGGNFDYIISKNTLKKGYVHPEKPVDPSQMVVLGVSDEAFVQALFETLKPGGLMMIYNICPAQSQEKYIPWADGKNPFPKEVWEKAGFKVIKFDQEDQDGVKAMAKALGWNVGESPMDIDHDLFAWYTIVQKSTDAKDESKPEGEAATHTHTPAATK